MPILISMNKQTEAGMTETLKILVCIALCFTITGPFPLHAATGNAGKPSVSIDSDPTYWSWVKEDWPNDDTPYASASRTLDQMMRSGSLTEDTILQYGSDWK